MTIMLILLGVVIWFALWVTIVRPFLRTRDWAWSQAMFRIIEPIEIWLWNKSETILWARFQAVVALLLAFLPWIGAIDVTPWLTAIPEQHHWWVKLIPVGALALNSLVTEVLRRDTTMPLKEVEKKGSLQ